MSGIPRSPSLVAPLEAIVTTATAAQYLSLFRKYMFHRDYILEHCSPGLVAVWREVLTMMKVVVYLAEQRGSIQLFLIKDINAFLLDNEAMPLDKDIFSPTGGSGSPSPSPSPSTLLTPTSASSSPSTTPEPRGNAAGLAAVRASKSFHSLSNSLRMTFRSRSVSTPAFTSEEEFPVPQQSPLSSSSTSPTSQTQQQQQQFPHSPPLSRGYSPLLMSQSPPLGEQESVSLSHQRSNSGVSLISKIFKSRSFDFKQAREPSVESRVVEQHIEDAIAESVNEEEAEEEGNEEGDDEETAAETDTLSPLPTPANSRRRRSVSMSGPLPAEFVRLSSSPVAPSIMSNNSSDSQTPRLRRCSSFKYSSPTGGMKRSASATSHVSLSSFSPPAAAKSFMELFASSKDDDFEKSDSSDDSFSLFGSKAKDLEKDLAREQLVKSSYRYHMRRRAVCLFHNENTDAEDPPRPSRAS